MAKYSDIKGFTVQTLSTDTVASQIAGGAWTSVASLSTSRIGGVGAGTSPAAIMAGGYLGPPGGSTVTETWNGSSWTEVNDMNTAYFYGQGFGTTSAMVLAGRDGPGSPSKPAATETWNGTSWSAPGANINTNRFLGGGAGTSTAGIVFGGQSPTTRANTESWNGSAWTEVNDLNTAKNNIGGGTGTYTAALSAGGDPFTTEQWDGSSWTEITDNNTQRKNAVKTGTTTDALMTGGYTPPGSYSAATESWDGSAWTEVSDIATARGYSGAGGSGYASSAAIIFGGSTSPAIVGNAEEWSAPATFNKITEGQLYFNSTTNTFKETILDVPGGTWASNTAAPTASTERWGAGTSNSNALIGAPPGAAMEWNGSAWTDGGTVNSNNQGRGGTGGATAALIWGGTSSPAVTEQYNGTAWTEVNDLNQGGSSQPTGPTGTYTDLISAGRGPGFSGVSESWDGTSWTETADLSTSRRSLGSSGASSTDCAVFGGTIPPNNNIAKTEQWNGTAWTETTDLNTARGSGMGFGVSSQTLAYVAGTSYPSLPPYNTKTEAFNGSTWTEVNDLPNGRYHNKGGGSASSALTAGGYLASPAGGQTTENLVWEANLSNKTITAS